MKKTSFLLLLSGFLILNSCKQDKSTIDPSSGIAVEKTIKNEDNKDQAISNINNSHDEPTNPKLNNSSTSEMTFEHKVHDFGVIKAESKVDHTFTFTNSGKDDLLITNAQGSCGCTVPDYPKEAIKAGEKGKIKVSFNSAGKSGQQEKTVTLFTNTAKGNEVITIKAIIK